MTTRLFIFLIMALTFVRCDDSETFKPGPDHATFTASAFVEVQDDKGNSLQGVRIQVGNVEGYTDDEGVLYLKEIEMNPATYLKASRSGYFNGSRRFYPSPDKTNFIKLMMLPEQLAGTIQASTGGVVQVTDVVRLEFPSNGIMDKNGQAYNGVVSVYGQPISADDPDLSAKMPGDLVGISDEGGLGSLASLGMVVVELRSATGELLRVKSGSKVEMQMQVATSLLSTAPATIPMWYFDEDLGLWKEEGEAVLSGSAYIAQLGHFSFWNCDAWFPLVKWGATFVYESGAPASQVAVCLTILGLQTTSCSYTNEEGFVCGMVALNEEMLLEVKSPCGDVIYSQQIGPYSDTTMIGPITIPSTSVSTSAISGVAVDCDGEAVTNGFARIQSGGQNYFTALDETTGAFSVSVMNCDETDIIITVVDEEAVKQSLPQTYTYASVIDAGTITVCESLSEYVDIEIVGLPDHVIYYFPNAAVQGNFTTINTADSTSNQQYFYVMVEGTSVGTYVATASEVGFILPNGDRAYATGLVLTFTYFGGAGDYLTGTLTGTLHTGPNGQGGPDYPLLGTFSVSREF